MGGGGIEDQLAEHKELNPVGKDLGPISGVRSLPRFSDIFLTAANQRAGMGGNGGCDVSGAIAAGFVTAR